MAETKKVQYIQPEGDCLLVKLELIAAGEGLPDKQVTQLRAAEMSAPNIASGVVVKAGPTVRSNTWEGTFVYFDLGASRSFYDNNVNAHVVVVSEADIYASRREIIPINLVQNGDRLQPKF